MRRIRRAVIPQEETLLLRARIAELEKELEKAKDLADALDRKCDSLLYTLDELRSDKDRTDDPYGYRRNHQGIVYSEQRNEVRRGSVISGRNVATNEIYSVFLPDDMLMNATRRADLIQEARREIHRRLTDQLGGNNDIRRVEERLGITSSRISLGEIYGSSLAQRERIPVNHIDGSTGYVWGGLRPDANAQQGGRMLTDEQSALASRMMAESAEIMLNNEATSAAALMRNSEPRGVSMSEVGTIQNLTIRPTDGATVRIDTGSLFVDTDTGETNE